MRVELSNQEGVVISVRSWINSLSRCCKFIAKTLAFQILCRMTLLLGPPGSGKTTLLKALSGKLDSQLQVTCLTSMNFINELRYSCPATYSRFLFYDSFLGE